MAFTIRNLSVLAYANGFTQWHYRDNSDSVLDIDCPNYFGNASDMFAVGDLIIISCDEGVMMRAVSHSTADSVLIVPLLP
jgi:hypothetical protein